MKKIILWLSVSVALLAAAMFAVVKKMPYFSPSGKSTGDLVYAGADELTGITVRFGKEKIKLRKLDGSWLVNGYYGRNAAADEYANRLQRATILSFSDAAPRGDGSLFPSCRRKIRDGASSASTAKTIWSAKT